MLNYVTYKYVVLKDFRLALLYYTLVGAIVAYTLMEMFIHKGYLYLDTHPQGTIKIVISENLSNESFDLTELPYCRGKIKCRSVDPMDLTWPVESRAVTIATFVKDREQLLNEDSYSPDEEYNLKDKDDYFTQGPEYVVMKVDHAVVASDASGRERLAASQRQLTGYLVDINNIPIKMLSPGEGKPDEVSLKDLMLAAGMTSLDDASDAIGAGGRSFREMGCVLRVTIFYENWYSTIFGTSTREVQGLHRDDGQSLIEQSKQRLLKKRYAAHVEFVLAGSLGMFSPTSLLIRLVSGVGLFTLAVTVIDTLTLYILPTRHQYRKYIYDESPNIKKLE